eukprot:scaffold238_cov532-Prasinococcus_capsulatus_cf.AAC.7
MQAATLAIEPGHVELRSGAQPRHRIPAPAVSQLACASVERWSPDPTSTKCRDTAVKDIGAGNFGIARLLKSDATGELVAVKFIERGPMVDENVRRE